MSHHQPGYRGNYISQNPFPACFQARAAPEWGRTRSGRQRWSGSHTLKPRTNPGSSVPSRSCSVPSSSSRMLILVTKSAPRPTTRLCCQLTEGVTLKSQPASAAFLPRQLPFAVPLPELGLPTLQIPRSLFTGQGWSVNFLWSLTPLFWSLLTQLFLQLYKL